MTRRLFQFWTMGTYASEEQPWDVLTVSLCSEREPAEVSQWFRAIASWYAVSLRVPPEVEAVAMVEVTVGQPVVVHAAALLDDLRRIGLLQRLLDASWATPHERLLLIGTRETERGNNAS